MPASPVTEVEAKAIHKVLKVAQTKSASDDLDKLLEKHKSWHSARGHMDREVCEEHASQSMS